VLTPQRADAGNRAVVEFSAYLRGLIAQRRAQPGDPETDVLTRLIEGDGDDDRLTETELVHQCIFLLNAGHETTTNLIDNALHALTLWPGERARLVADPELVQSAVEEFLRFESSNQLGDRISTAPSAIGRFLARFPHYALDGAPTRGGRARFRGFLHLPASVSGCNSRGDRASQTPRSANYTSDTDAVSSAAAERRSHRCTGS